MSLQVWLPLNGNLNNQGLAKVNLLNFGATVADGGKIGKCYKFNPENSQSSTKYIDLRIKSSQILRNGQSFSLCAWFKITGDYYGNGAGIIACNQYHDDGFALMMRVGTQIGIQMCFGNGTEQEWYPITGLVRDTWYHTVFTYNEEGRVCSLYLNGNFVASDSMPYDWTNKNYNIWVGRGQQGGWSYDFPGYLNDVRIYDHCLSQKEVSEIAKGLVLHYKMDDREVLLSRYNSIVWNQLVRNGDFSNGTTVWGCSHSVLSTENNTLSIITNSTSPIGSTALVNFNFQYKSLIIEGHKYLIKFSIIRNISGSISCYVGNVYNNFGSNFNANEWYNLSWITTSGISANLDRFYIYPYNNTSKTSASAQLKNIMLFDLTLMFGAGNEPTLEEFEYMFPGDYFAYDTGTTIDIKKTLPDYSGFGYDGTINGSANNTLTLDNTTPRYQKCTKFDGNSYIAPSGINVSNATELSVCCWAKPTTASLSYLWGMNNAYLGTSQFTTGLDNALSVRDNSSGGVSGTLFKYSLGDVTPNQWTCLCCTYNKGDVKVYRDGILLSTNTTGGNALNNTIDEYWVGQSHTTYGRKFNGNISDFRIFTTALSDNDILNLYHDSLSINNLQGSHCWEYIEDDTMLESSPVDVKRTGVVKAKRLSEAIVSFYDKETYVEPDGSVWIHLFHHNAPSTNGLFSRGDSFTTKVYKDEHRWFDMSVCDYVNRWEMMIKQKLTSDANELKYRFIQNVNPMVATSEEVKSTNITKITTSGYANLGSVWGGISVCNAGTTYLWTYGNGNWTGAIGCWTRNDGGSIPGIRGNCTTGYFDVYLRIDNLDDITLARLGKEGLISDQLNEI